MPSSEDVRPAWNEKFEPYVPNGDIASQTKVLRLEDLVRARVIKDGLGVDTSLVRERAVPTTFQESDYNQMNKVKT